MLGSEVIEVGIGMALLFFFMSLTATVACEVVENFVKARATDLEQGIKEILSSCIDAEDTKLCEKFYKHPLIASLYAGTYVSQSRNLPSYIPRGHFAEAFFDLLKSRALTTKNLQPAPASPAQQFLSKIADAANEDVNKTRKAIEAWYDGTMDRVAGWYKRRTSYRLAVIGIIATVFFNVDAISVAQSLVHDKALRETVVARSEAMTAAEGQAPPAIGKTLKEISAALDQVGYPIGWTWVGRVPYPKPQACISQTDEKGTLVSTCSNWLVGVGGAIPGWIVTVLAVMLGAPFWFDVLNKLMVIRSTVKPREKSQDEGSEDRPNSTARDGQGGDKVYQ